MMVALCICTNAQNNDVTTVDVLELNKEVVLSNKNYSTINTPISYSFITQEKINLSIVFFALGDIEDINSYTVELRNNITKKYVDTNQYDYGDVYNLECVLGSGFYTLTYYVDAKDQYQFAPTIYAYTPQGNAQISKETARLGDSKFTDNFINIEGHNAITTITPTSPTSTIDYVDDVIIMGDGASKQINIQYFDGLGQPCQKIDVGISPNRSDLVSMFEYDILGRESKIWMPTIKANNNGAFLSLDDFKMASSETYNSTGLNASPDSKPYSQPIYEQSILDRVLKQIGPGAAWHTQSITTAKAISTEYSTNSGTSGNLSCALFTVDGTGINTKVKKNNFYANGQLYVTKITNEDNHISYEFKDKLGQVVLTRQLAGSAQHDTYYIYDDFGNLSYVLPPKAVDEVSNYADTDVKMKQYAYIYKYDSRNRCVWKKLPGADPILYVYDKADQLIFTQDGEQRKNSEWLFTLSDIFGRSVLNGTIKGNTSIKSGMWDDIMAAPVVRANYTGATSNLGYQITGFVFTPTTLISANFYDNYSFLGKNTIPNNVNTQYNIETGYDVCYGNHTDLLKSKGLLTGTLTAQLPSGTMLYSIMYYDDKGRVIQTKSNNHLSGGVEKEYIAYNFTGQPTKKMHIHQAKDKPTQMEFYAYEYDHAGRLLKTKHKLDGLPETILAENTYDELGRLKTNKKGNKFATTYDYNIRSWTKSIETKNGATLLFSQKLYYNDKVTAHNYSDYQESYSGNVSGMEWQLQGEAKRSNRFHYDELSRLKNSAYNGVTSGGVYNTSYSYDKHGNILNLVQNGLVSGATKAIDNLKMSYIGNQLNNIHNEGTGLISNSSAHFQDYSVDKTLAKQEYTYNANGAMASDLNKGISSITYNSLNLPTKLTIDNISKGGKAKGTIEYMYSASGTKLRTIHTDNAAIAKNAPILTTSVFATTTDVKTTDYVGNKIYENGKLKQTLIDGGYIKDGKYYYYLTDHLGNKRAVAEATTGTLLQKTHYYPFGMAFAETTGEQEQPFKYNGKELDREMQLNIYDYAARYMDPAIGRFTSIDPLAEKYYSISPYAYVMNNPLKYIDPTGKETYLYYVGTGGRLTGHTAIGVKPKGMSRTYYNPAGGKRFGKDYAENDYGFSSSYSEHATIMGYLAQGEHIVKAKLNLPDEVEYELGQIIAGAVNGKEGRGFWCTGDVYYNIYDAYLNAGYTEEEAKKAANKYVNFSIPKKMTAKEMHKAGFSGFEMYWSDEQGNSRRYEVNDLSTESKRTKAQGILNDFSNLQEGTYKWDSSKEQWVRQ